MKANEAKEILIKNNYVIHKYIPELYYNRLTSYCFIVQESIILMWRVSGGNINIKEDPKIISLKSFNPSIYNLKVIKVKKVYNPQLVPIENSEDIIIDKDEDDLDEYLGDPITEF